MTLSFIHIEEPENNRPACCKDVANWCCGCGQCLICEPQHTTQESCVGEEPEDEDE